MKEIVIKIDENVFTRLFDNGIEDYAIINDDLYAIAKSIRLCTPLPEGHGDLIDRNSVHQIVRPIEQSDAGWGVTAETAIKLIHDAFNKAPTLVDADKE